MSIVKAKVENRLLEALTSDQFQRISDHVTTVVLRPGQVLYGPEQPITHLYFPIDSAISLLSITKEGNSVEIGMIGQEGVVGVAALLGTNTLSCAILVQAGGKAKKVPLSLVQDLFAQNGPFRALLLRYLYCVIVQITQSAICSMFHSVENRVARWLLSTHDRIPDEPLPYTHEFLATILGTRRVSITLALGSMEKAGVLENHRGKIVVKNRSALEALTCECYGISKVAIESVFNN
jgi:CRP-like cAMP-binding protein